MNCREVQKQLTDYLERQVTESQALALARHLEDCSSCAQHLQSLRDLIVAIHGLPDLVVAESFTEAVLAQTTRVHAVKEWAEPEGYMPRFVAVCAGVISVGFLALGITLGKTLQPVLLWLSTNVRISPWFTKLLLIVIEAVHFLFYFSKSLLVVFKAILNDVWLTQPLLLLLASLMVGLIGLSFYRATRQGYLTIALSQGLNKEVL